MAFSVNLAFFVISGRTRFHEAISVNSTDLTAALNTSMVAFLWSCSSCNLWADTQSWLKLLDQFSLELATPCFTPFNTVDPFQERETLIDPFMVCCLFVLLYCLGWYTFGDSKTSWGSFSLLRSWSWLIVHDEYTIHRQLFFNRQASSRQYLWRNAIQFTFILSPVHPCIFDWEIVLSVRWFKLSRNCSLWVSRQGVPKWWPKFPIDAMGRFPNIIDFLISLWIPQNPSSKMFGCRWLARTPWTCNQPAALT